MQRIIVLCSILVLLVPFAALAQEACEGNFDCDQDVDGTDASVFKFDFGRSSLKNPCPICPAPAEVPKTGQTTFYLMGDDGWFETGVAWPSPRFINNGDNTVTDTLTGLMWWDYYPIYTYDWGSAVLFCYESIDHGYHDWRLPTIRELLSLIDYSRQGPAISSPTPITIPDPNDYLWSSTSLVGGSSAWFVYLWNGDTGMAWKSDSDKHAVCVRGPIGQPFRFTKNGDGTVTDNDTGLVWLEDATCDDINGGIIGVTWQVATAAVAVLNSGECGLSDGSNAGDWRLPSGSELQDLLCSPYDYPALCNQAGTGQWTEGNPFINVSFDWYWSSSQVWPDSHGVVNVGDGSSLSGMDDTETLFVWPVRGGQ